MKPGVGLLNVPTVADSWEMLLILLLVGIFYPVGRYGGDG